MEIWHFLSSPAADAPMNMAVDETLLRHAADRRQPLLRLYSWSRPSISFGYFQKFPEHLAGQYEIVRRPTGGGVVYHVDDTTYTVVVPPGHTLHQMPTSAAYCALHRAVAAALDFQSQIANLKSPALRGEYECFQNPVHGDVVAAGRKMAGGAQRRGRAGMLHQGSIAARVSAEQLQLGFARVLGVEFTPYALTESERAQAEQLATTKYATTVWNHRR